MNTKASVLTYKNKSALKKKKAQNCSAILLAWENFSFTRNLQK